MGRLTRLGLAAALAAAVLLPGTAGATGGCTVYWRPLLPPGHPVQVYYPYCIW